MPTSKRACAPSRGVQSAKRCGCAVSFRPVGFLRHSFDAPIEAVMNKAHHGRPALCRQRPCSGPRRCASRSSRTPPTPMVRSPCSTTECRRTTSDPHTHSSRVRRDSQRGFLDLGAASVAQRVEGQARLGSRLAVALQSIGHARQATRPGTSSSFARGVGGLGRESIDDPAREGAPRGAEPPASRSLCLDSSPLRGGPTRPPARLPGGFAIAEAGLGPAS